MVIEKHEVDPVITVTRAADVFTVKHYGAGTLTHVIMDGAKTAFTRGATGAGFVEEVVEMDEEVVEKKVKDKKEDKK